MRHSHNVTPPLTPCMHPVQAIRVPIGLMRTYQPLRITVEDQGAQSGVGHEFTCIARTVPRSEAARAKYTPECFYYGTATAGGALEDKFQFFYVLPGYIPHADCDIADTDGNCAVNREDPTSSAAVNGKQTSTEPKYNEVLLCVAYPLRSSCYAAAQLPILHQRALSSSKLTIILNRMRRGLRPPLDRLQVHWDPSVQANR